MKKTFRTMVVLVLAVCGVAPGAAAQVAQETTAQLAPVPADRQATREQLVKLFDVMRLRSQFNAAMKAMPAMISQQIRAQVTQMTASVPGSKPLTPAEQAKFDSLMRKYIEKAQSLYPADEMVSDAVTIYQRHMTREDADAYIAFYSSPAGQHLLDAQPAIMQEYMPIVMKRMQERSKELYADFAKDLQGMTAAKAPAK